MLAKDFRKQKRYEIPNQRKEKRLREKEVNDREEK